MKKKLLIIALVVCLLAVAAFGTLAYFTDTAQVINTFSVSSDEDFDPTDPNAPDLIFSIDLYEHDGEQKVTAKEFTDFLPGDVLTKDPTVEVVGAESAWVRMTVTVTEAADWQTALAAHSITSLETIFGGFNASAWTRFDAPVVDADNDTISYTYYYNTVMNQGDTATLFTTVTIPGALTVEELLTLAEFEMTIQADAIQSANTGDSAYAAFTNYWE